MENVKIDTSEYIRTIDTKKYVRLYKEYTSLLENYSDIAMSNNGDISISFSYAYSPKSGIEADVQAISNDLKRVMLRHA